MQRNVGPTDRTIRIILGLVLLSLIFFIDGNARWLGLIGLIPLFTAAIGYCPGYKLFGLSSCPLKKKS
ncbi:YgaP family membrane protein [Bartonella sp. LJL80]